MTTHTKFLSSTQYAGLVKAGDVMIPGDGDFPSFSRSGCAEQADRMLAFLNPSDRDGLLLLLAIFRFLPRIAVRAILSLSARAYGRSGRLAAVLRLIDLGVKGAVMTMYYSDVGGGPSIHRLIGWDAKIVERDEPTTEGK